MTDAIARKRRSVPRAALALALALVAGGAAGLAVAGVAAGLARAEQGGTSPVEELVRKSQAREHENGFCAQVKWPAGNTTAYTQWLDGAIVGAHKVNSFKNGAQCQYDRVADVFQRDGAKCVRYTWFACETGKTCATGAATACKQPDGTWKTQG